LVDHAATPAREEPNCSSAGCLSRDELQYDTKEFDPAAYRCKVQLANKLGLSQNAMDERLTLNTGGMNNGMWTFCDASQTLMLKLVTSQRHHSMVPTEAENFLKLATEYPNLANDKDFTFPLKIFRCKGSAGHTHDLIVMRKAAGECFADVIQRKWKSRRVPELMQDFEALGCFLAKIHNTHGLQHGDCQPSNIFYDEASKHFTMIDIADLAPRSACKMTESDVEHFCVGVRLLSRYHGDQLQSEGVPRFKAGYAKGGQCP